MRNLDALIIRTENTARHDQQSLAKNVNTQQKNCFSTEKKKIKELFSYSNFFFDYTKRWNGCLDESSLSI